MPTENRFDEPVLEEFVTASVPALAPRLADLRLCGPRNFGEHAGPATDQELARCHNFLKDLESHIQGTTPHSLALRAALIALRYSAGSERFSDDDEGPVSYMWRDAGMAKMIGLFRSTAKRTIVIAHNLHVFHAGQDVIPFATKSMGSFLDDAYGQDYVVIGCLSGRPAKAAWWNGEQLYQPGPGSVESELDTFGGSVLVNVKTAFASGTTLEMNGAEPARIRSHVDGIVYIPISVPMTNAPGVQYPQ